MNCVDRYIASCPSWEVFWQRTTRLSTAEMGRAFERLVQLYLQTEPEYRTILRHVWTSARCPPASVNCVRDNGPSDVAACVERDAPPSAAKNFRRPT
jgi:hypothetical protein